jgi:RNA polymerase sigma-70 factor, ECF subfamily
VTEQDQLAADFEAHRPYLHAIAFRVLGSHADADDAVQEAWLRLARAGGDGIGELRGWLTTVTGRICLDVLRRRGARGEQPLEPDLWTIPSDFSPDPEEEALIADSVGLALYVVMDALTPAERVSFVLHDVFELPFDTIAAILGRSTASAKMLASRARGRIRLGAPAADARTGLLAVLAPGVELHRGTTVTRGADQVAGQAILGARLDTRTHPALVNGLPGALITASGRPFILMAFTVAQGRITTIRMLSDRKRLAQLVPSWVA